MSRPEFRRVHRADRHIPPAAINAPQEALEKVRDFYAPGGGLDFGVPGVPVKPREMLLATITAADNSSPTKYSWQRVGEPVTDAKGVSCAPWYDQITGGPASPAGVRPAYEINENPAVPLGAMVELWPSQNGECMFFKWQPCCPDSGDNVITPRPPPTIVQALPTLTVGQPTANYTFVTTLTSGGLETITSAPVTATGPTPISPANPITLVIAVPRPTPDRITIYETVTTLGLVSLTTFNPITGQPVTTDANGFPLPSTITVTPNPGRPWNVSLVPASPPPTTASPTNTVVGTLVATNPNPTANPSPTFTYVTTTPNFTIVGSNLVLINPTTATPGQPITVTVTVTDNQGLTITRPITVTVYQPTTTSGPNLVALVPAVPPPTTASPTNTIVGTLVTTDPGPNPTFTYVTTTPNFTIVGSNLVLTNPVTTTPGQPVTVTVTVTATDNLGLTITKPLTVTIYLPITTVTYTPALPLPTTSSPANTVVGTLVTVDPNPSPTFTYALTTPNNSLIGITATGNLVLLGPVTTPGPITVTAQVTDNLGLTVALTLTVLVLDPADTTTPPPPAAVVDGAGNPEPLLTVTLTTPAVDTTKPPPTSDATGMIVTSSVSNAILSVPILAPTATLAAPVTGAASASVQVTVKTPLGESLPSTTATIANAPATISPGAPLSVTITPPANVPGWKLPTLQYGLYLTGGTITNALGLVGVYGPFATAGAQTVSYTGGAPLPSQPAAPPATNTTATSTIPTLTSLNIAPLSNPAAPTVTPLTTGATNYTYKLVASDGAGSTAASAGASISNGAATPNNAVTWTSTPAALSYDVYRTAGGATQGKLGTVYAGQPLVFVDAAAAGDGSTAPAVNTTGQLTVGGVPVATGGTATVPQWQQFKVTFTALKAIGATNSGRITIGTLAAGAVVHDGYTHVDTKLVAAGATAGNFGVGFGTNDNYLIGTKECVAAGSDASNLFGTYAGVAGSSVSKSTLVDRVATENITAVLTLTTANANTLTAGQVTVNLLISQPSWS